MFVWTVFYTTTDGYTGLWGIYAEEYLAQKAKETIISEGYGSNVHINKEEVITH